MFKDSKLVGEKSGRVRELAGYQKPKTPLAKHDDWEQKFVERCGADEVAQLATSLHDRIRRGFGYKRKELEFTNDGAVASIKTPDFDLNVTLAQDPEDAERYLLRTEAVSFRRPEIVEEAAFLEVFAADFQKVLIVLSAGYDLEEKIDEIEELDEFAKQLDYDPNCTYFTLRMPGINVVLHATAEQLVFSLLNPAPLTQLIANTLQAMSRLASVSLMPGVPKK